MVESIHGIDYTWFALDSESRVGVFTTGGEGPIPVWVTRDWADPLYDKLEAYSAFGGYRVVVGKRFATVFKPTDPLAHWKLWASRGLYAYDWTDVHRAFSDRINHYELIAEPLEPLIGSSVPEVLMRQPRLTNSVFANRQLVAIP